MEQPGTSEKVYAILIVDDDRENRSVLSHLLCASGYATAEAEDGKAALRWLSAALPDLILLDLQMPGMGGLEVLRHLKENERTRQIPAIIVTGEMDTESRLTALRSGADDFLTKPVDGMELTLRVRNHLRLKEYADLMREHSRSLERQVARRTEELRGSYREATILLVSAAEFRDTDTGDHIRRVSRFAAEIARRMGLGDEYVESIFVASPMHDIGKIAIPDRILLKSAPLDSEEWEIMKTHTVLEAQILRAGSTAYVRMGAEIAESHHERWDGSGYPRGLAGEAIPLSGRIMSVCDVYDALRSQRPYKAPYSHRDAVRIMLEGDGRTHPNHFCPQALAAFRNGAGSFEEIYATPPEGAAPAAAVPPA